MQKSSSENHLQAGQVDMIMQRASCFCVHPRTHAARKALIKQKKVTAGLTIAFLW